MSSDLPAIDELRRVEAASDQHITPEDVSVMGQIESEWTGDGPIEQGPSATTQGLPMRQMNFNAKLDELAHKPHSHITQEDARQIQELESRAFNKPPTAGSVASQIRAIADRNKALGLPQPPVSADGPAAYVIKGGCERSPARRMKDLRRTESTQWGGAADAGR